MKKLFLSLLFLASPLFADARKYDYQEPHLNAELDAIYHDLLYLKSVTASISSATITSLQASTGTFTGRLTIRNGTISTDAAAFGQIPAASKVVQVVSTTTASSFSTTSAAYQTTVLSGAFTPTSATNKVFLIASFSADMQTQNVECRSTLARNNSSLFASAMGDVDTTTGGEMIAPVTLSYSDSPATTSQIIYAVQIKTDGVRTCAIPGFTQSLVMVEYVP